jgi:hypothetical protein
MSRRRRNVADEQDTNCNGKSFNRVGWGKEGTMRTGVSNHLHVRAASAGSSEAVEHGCTCDPVENHYGEGQRGLSGTRLFIPDEKCPLHGVEAVFGGPERVIPQRRDRPLSEHRTGAAYPPI